MKKRRARVGKGAGKGVAKAGAAKAGIRNSAVPKYGVAITPPKAGSHMQPRASQVGNTESSTQSRASNIQPRVSNIQSRGSNIGSTNRVSTSKLQTGNPVLTKAKLGSPTT